MDDVPGDRYGSARLPRADRLRPARPGRRTTRSIASGTWRDRCMPQIELAVHAAGRPLGRRRPRGTAAVRPRHARPTSAGVLAGPLASPLDFTAAAPTGAPMTDDGAISRSVLAEQVKDRLLQDILSGPLPAPLADRRDAGRARAGHQPGAGARGAARPRGARASWRSCRSAARASADPSAQELLEAYAVRSELEALGARLGVPRMTDAGPRRARGARRGDAAGRRGRRPPRGRRRATPASTPASSPSPATRPSSASGGPSSRSPARTSRSSRRAPTPNGRRTSIRRSWRALRRRATRSRSWPRCASHFDEAGAHLAETGRTRRPDEAAPAHGPPAGRTDGRSTRRAERPPVQTVRRRGQARPRIARTCSATRAAERP